MNHLLIKDLLEHTIIGIIQESYVTPER